MAEWAAQAGSKAPRKSDQDMLDTVVCALTCYWWLFKPPLDSVMIGDLRTGYMIAPASAEVRQHLDRAEAASPRSRKALPSGAEV